MTNQSLYDIILPLAIADVYTYRILDAREASYGTATPIGYGTAQALIGCRVLVPLGKKSIIGII